MVHEILFFRDNSIKMQPDTIPISFKEAIENGKYTLNDEHGQVISEGRFNAGFREGCWIYHSTDTATIEIDWTKYVNDSSSVEINYPRNWEILEDPDRPFQASFPLKQGEDKKGKYFISYRTTRTLLIWISMTINGTIITNVFNGKNRGICSFSF